MQIQDWAIRDMLYNKKKSWQYNKIFKQKYMGAEFAISSYV